MKRTFYLLIFAAIAAAASAQPKAVFPQISHDFGVIPEEGGLAQCRFAVVNEGTEPLSIVSARATCGCTTPQYPRKSIAPGDTAYVEVAYDPSGRPGRFIKPVYVETNGSKGKTRLEINGVVIGSEESVSRRYPVDMGPLRLMRPVFSFGEGIMGKLKTVYMEGYNKSTDSLRIAIENIPPYLDVVVAPKVVPPGEQCTLIAYVSPQKANYGVVEDTLTIIPIPGFRYELPTIITVKEDFTGITPDKMEKAPIAVPSTERIELGKVSRTIPISTSLKLSNEGQSDLKIRRIYSVDKGVKVHVDTDALKKGKTAKIDVEIDPSMQDGSMLNTRLQIITNDPLQPGYTVRIVGEWE